MYFTSSLVTLKAEVSNQLTVLKLSAEWIDRLNVRVQYYFHFLSI